jgi:hypothetical protein
MLCNAVHGSYSVDSIAVHGSYSVDSIAVAYSVPQTSITLYMVLLSSRFPFGFCGKRRVCFMTEVFSILAALVSRSTVRDLTPSRDQVSKKPWE